jgi:hypothetical protein
LVHRAIIGVQFLLVKGLRRDRRGEGARGRWWEKSRDKENNGNNIEELGAEEGATQAPRDLERRLESRGEASGYLSAGRLKSKLPGEVACPRQSF